MHHEMDVTYERFCGLRMEKTFKGAWLVCWLQLRFKKSQHWVMRLLIVTIVFCKIEQLQLIATMHLSTLKCVKFL